MTYRERRIMTDVLLAVSPALTAIGVILWFVVIAQG